MKEKTIYELKNQIITKIEGAAAESDEIVIETKDHRYRMFHYQDCCEYVRVTEIVGNLENILNQEIIKAEEFVDSGPTDSKYDQGSTMTDFKLTTEKGVVTIKWVGESNGYYSESVAFEEIN